MEQLSATLEGLTLTLIELVGEQLTIAFRYDAGWSQLSVDGWFWPADFTDFMQELDKLYTSLQEQAALKPRYGSECMLTLNVDSLGHVKGKLHLEYRDDIFEGHLECDQSYLPDFHRDCKSMWAQLASPIDHKERKSS